MNSDYPNSIDSFITKANRAGQTYDPTATTKFFAEDANKLANAIIQIEQTLGETPSGSFNSVKDRVANNEVIASLPVQMIEKFNIRTTNKSGMTVSLYFNAGKWVSNGQIKSAPTTAQSKTLTQNNYVVIINGNDEIEILDCAFSDIANNLQNGFKLLIGVGEISGSGNSTTLLPFKCSDYHSTNWFSDTGTVPAYSLENDFSVQTVFTKTFSSALTPLRKYFAMLVLTSSSFPNCVTAKLRGIGSSSNWQTREYFVREGEVATLFIPVEFVSSYNGGFTLAFDNFGTAGNYPTFTYAMYLVPESGV